MKDKIQNFKIRLDELETMLGDPKVTGDQEKMKEASQEYARAKQILELDERLVGARKALVEAESTLAEEGEESEMGQLAKEELQGLRKNAERLERELRVAIVPPDPLDEKDIMVEIRAGAGGDESALFAAELFRMYSRFAERHGWKSAMVSANRIGIGGFKEIIFEISGQGAFGLLKFESGVHRVQRVPETEKSGRIHTSTVTVAVLPQAEEVDVNIDAKDLRIDTFCSSGAGGQSVNTTYSAIRITHVPTDTIVSCQDERSQQQNKERAMQVLRAKLLAAEEEKRLNEQAAERKSQIGWGMRAEKIRTYNFPQSRVTDHRIKQNFHNIGEVMDGGLDELIAMLRQADAGEED